MRHGDLALEAAEAEQIAQTDDPELALVNADMHAWMLEHPCECHALCTCEESQ